MMIKRNYQLDSAMKQFERDLREALRATKEERKMNKFKLTGEEGYPDPTPNELPKQPLNLNPGSCTPDYTYHAQPSPIYTDIPTTNHVEEIWIQTPSHGEIKVFLELPNMYDSRTVVSEVFKAGQNQYLISHPAYDPLVLILKEPEIQ